MCAGYLLMRRKYPISTENAKQLRLVSLVDVDFKWFESEINQSQQKTRKWRRRHWLEKSNRSIRLAEVHNSAKMKEKNPKKKLMKTEDADWNNEKKWKNKKNCWKWNAYAPIKNFLPTQIPIIIFIIISNRSDVQIFDVFRIRYQRYQCT